jgi:SNF2 family DNA or RNA helicase
MELIFYLAENLILFLMKLIPSFEPFLFQTDTINILLEIVKYNNGACIFDETGLGKTITASTTAINVTDGKINVIAPKSNQKNWKDVLSKTPNFYEISTYAKPSLEKCEVLIIDEAHNLRNEKSKSFVKIFEYIKRHNPVVLLLTATPFQNNIREFRNVISLINFKSNTPAFIMLGSLFHKAIEAEKKIKTIERYSDDSYEAINETSKVNFIQDKHIDTISKVVNTFSVRNTRISINEKYVSDVKLMGHFPTINKSNIEAFFNPDEIIKIGQIIDILSSMKFAMQNIIYYSNHPRYKNQNFFGGLMKTFLLKRLDSSLNAFKKSTEKMLVNIETELLKGNYTIDIEGSTYPLNDNYELHLLKDKESLQKIKQLSEELNDDKKVELLFEIIKDRKAVIFTEYKDTLEIINQYLSKTYKEFICYSSESNESLLDLICDNFDANNITKNNIQIVATTDVLSEGVNLHQADILIHFDQKWNPSKIIQREGRVNRIIKNGIHREISIYHFQVDKLIENIIELDKKIVTKQNLSHKFLKGEKLQLQWMKDFKENVTIFYPNENESGKFYQVYESYMGHIFAEEYGLISDSLEFAITPFEIPDSFFMEEKYYSYFNKHNYLYGKRHEEFNPLYRDAWYEVSKLYSKNSFDVDFFDTIERPVPKCCGFWLNKRKYLSIN